MRTQQGDSHLQARERGSGEPTPAGILSVATEPPEPWEKTSLLLMPPDCGILSCWHKQTNTVTDFQPIQHTDRLALRIKVFSSWGMFWLWVSFAFLYSLVRKGWILCLELWQDGIPLDRCGSQGNETYSKARGHEIWAGTYQDRWWGMIPQGGGTGRWRLESLKQERAAWGASTDLKKKSLD